MKNMVGFRNIAVRDYQSLLLPITERIITQHLDEFLAFTAHLLKREAQQHDKTLSPTQVNP